tara:strand:- start:371 stop:940 length:570 start_codon:yes stop_codon:yes gene_type:complete
MKPTEVLSQITPLSADCMLAIDELTEQKHYTKGSIIHPSGKVCKHLYFIESGLLRFFYHDQDAKDVTYQFFGENLFTSVINSYYTQTPSPYNIEAMEDSSLYVLRFADFEALLSRFPELDKVYHSVLREFLLSAEQRIISLQFYSAEERYRNLLENQPSILQRVSLGHIASYLGINQATLSRVRSKVRL